MHMYLNYAREHWTHPEENPPVGLILCESKGSMLAKVETPFDEHRGTFGEMLACDMGSTAPIPNPDNSRAALRLAQLVYE